jgi:isochorismate synthase
VIETDLNSRTLSDLVLALHPTPAVCGTPRPAAQAFIEAHETHDRALYAGFWGPWCPDGRTELFVNIRCMRVQYNEATVFAGAGITTGSDAGKEWQETGAKADVLLSAIARLPR